MPNRKNSVWSTESPSLLAWEGGEAPGILASYPHSCLKAILAGCPCENSLPPLAGWDHVRALPIEQPWGELVGVADLEPLEMALQDDTRLETCMRRRSPKKATPSVGTRCIAYLGAVPFRRESPKELRENRRTSLAARKISRSDKLRNYSPDGCSQAARVMEQGTAGGRTSCDSAPPCERATAAIS